MSAEVDIFAKAGKDAERQGCYECGGKAEMRLVLTAQKSESHRSLGPSISRGRSYCLEHGQALFLEILERFGKSV